MTILDYNTTLLDYKNYYTVIILSSMEANIGSSNCSIKFCRSTSNSQLWS